MAGNRYLQVGSVHKGFSETAFIQEVSASMRGLMRIHSPTLLITVNDLQSTVVDALKLSSAQAGKNTTLVQIPHSSFRYSLWMATVSPASLPCKISDIWVVSIAIIYQEEAVGIQCTLDCAFAVDVYGEHFSGL